MILAYLFGNVRLNVMKLFITKLEMLRLFVFGSVEYMSKIVLNLYEILHTNI